MTGPMPIRRRFALPAVLTALLVPFLAVAEGENEEWVEVTGEAAIVGDNEVHARQMAREQALRQAVEMVAGTIVTGISETQQFMAVRDDITSQSSGFVRRHEVKSQACSDGVCRVTVRALVAKGRLADHLSEIGLLIQQRGYPRVVMLISEQNVGEERPSAWWSQTEVRSQVVENTLVRYLNHTFNPDEKLANNPNRVCGTSFPPLDECWTPLDPGMRFRFMDYRSVAATPMVREAVSGTDLTDAQAQELGRLLDAEVALVGTARAEQIETGEGSIFGSAHRINGVVSFRAIDVSSGQIIGTASAMHAIQNVHLQRGGEVALAGAARRAVPQIQKAIAESWSAEQSGGRMVRLEVNGLGSWNDLIEFQNHLRSGVTGVRSVQQRRMDGSTAELEVQTTITTEQLATELATRPVGRFSVRVTRVDASSVGIQLGN
jgi:hypothetical protein